MGELINVVKSEVMSSLEIAEITGKGNCHVMRDIRNLVEKINQLRFESANNSDNKIAQLKFELGNNVTGNQRLVVFQNWWKSTIDMTAQFCTVILWSHKC